MVVPRHAAPLALLVAAGLAAGAGPACAADPVATYLAPPAACPGQDRADLPPPAQARSMACLINWARARAGLRALPSSPALRSAASRKTQLMLRCGQFSHEACGRPFDAVIRGAGFPGRSVGENIAWGNGPYASPRETMVSWLRSPEHRANILRRTWTTQGVAVRSHVTFQGYEGASVWASQFGAA